MSLILGLDMFSVLLSFFVVVLFWKILQKDERAAVINKLPGPMPIPFVGNVIEALEARDKVLSNVIKRRQKFGPIFRLWLGNYAVVVFSKAEYLEILLKSTKHTEKSFSYRFLQPWLGTGLLTSYGQKWANHRKLLTPTFHFKVLQSFTEVFQENANILAAKLEAKAKTGEEFDIYPLVTMCTLDIICETAMGTKIYAQSEGENEYVNSVYSLSAMVVYRTARMWLHPDFVYEKTSAGKEYQKHLKTVHGFTEKVIAQRKKALQNKSASEEEDEERKLTFLDLLLKGSMDNGSTQLTDLELREEVDTFMFEGHDTTAAGVNWALFLLGHHPKIQEDVYQELQSVLGDEKDKSPTIMDLANMKLLERVIKETLRLYPSVPSIARIVEEDTQFGPYKVPGGTTALINIYGLHRDPEHYPDPDVFDPDRFLPQNTHQRHPFSYLPFSAGPRNCIGQKFATLEEKVILSTLIRNFKFESVGKMEDTKVTPELILRPMFGIKMKVSKR